MTERILTQESKNNQMTMNVSIDNNSIFRPSISITQTESSVMGDLTQLSIETINESNQNQTQVHNLYSKLITNDLNTAKEKT